MGRLIKPQLNRVFKKKIEQLTLDLSERSQVIAVLVTESLCPNCIYDPTTKSSTGKFQTGGPKPFTGKVCPVCKAKGKITTEDRRDVPCNVRWGKGPVSAGTPPVPTPEGELPQNVAYLKTLVANKAVVTAATYFMVDDVRCVRWGETNPSGLLDQVLTKFYVKVDK